MKSQRKKNRTRILAPTHQTTLRFTLILNILNSSLKKGIHGRVHSWFVLGKATLNILLTANTRLKIHYFDLTEHRNSATAFRGDQRVCRSSLPLKEVLIFLPDTNTKVMSYTFI